MRNFKSCLITGITGSGGSYLAEHILNQNKNIKIFGFYRSNGYKDLLKKKHGSRVKLIKQDLTNYLSLKKKIKKINPNLIFHIASDADVRGSFDHPIEISNNNNTITINLLEACRKTKIDP